MKVQPISIDEQKSFGGIPFPLVLSPEPGGPQDLEAFVGWVSAHAAELKVKLQTHGAILFRNCPVDTAEAFEAVLEAGDFEPMPYVGGAAPRTQVTAKRILTANESPPSEPIPFHHEMAQVPRPPGYVFFFCDVAAERGGETAIVLSNRVYRRFVEIDPEFAAEVERQGVRYVRVMPDQDDASSPIGRSWRSTFLTDDRAEAEEKMREIGTSWTWLESGDLHTVTSVVPAIREDERTGQKTFFNSMVAAYTGWTDARNDPKRAVILADGSPVSGEALERTARAMTEESVAFPWQEGDLLFVDNRLVLHSRRPYEGPRRILASIALA